MLFAALQFSPIRGDIAANLATMQALVADYTFDLLVIPELASTGYFYTDPEELLPLAELPAEGEFTQWMLQLANQRNAPVIGGFAERDRQERLFNSAFIALPNGAWSLYRKTHLFYKEKLIFQPGDSGFVVTEWNGVRIGTMICYDWRFPESVRVLALRGADVIAHPSNLVAAKKLWGPTMCTRSFENKVISVTANRTGTETLQGETLSFTGESQIVGMNGVVLADCDPNAATMIVAEADPFATRSKAINSFNDLLMDRRPEMYEETTAKWQTNNR